MKHWTLKLYSCFTSYFLPGYLQDSPPPSNSSCSSHDEPDGRTSSPTHHVIVSGKGTPTPAATPPPRHTSVIRSAPRSINSANSASVTTITIPQYSYPPTPTTPTSRYHNNYHSNGHHHSYPEGCIPPPKKRELYRYDKTQHFRMKPSSNLHGSVIKDINFETIIHIIPSCKHSYLISDPTAYPNPLKQLPKKNFDFKMCVLPCLKENLKISQRPMRF